MTAHWPVLSASGGAAAQATSEARCQTLWQATGLQPGLLPARGRARGSFFGLKSLLSTDQNNPTRHTPKRGSPKLTKPTYDRALALSASESGATVRLRRPQGHSGPLFRFVPWPVRRWRTCKGPCASTAGVHCGTQRPGQWPRQRLLRQGQAEVTPSRDFRLGGELGTSVVPVAKSPDSEDQLEGQVRVKA